MDAHRRALACVDAARRDLALDARRRLRAPTTQRHDHEATAGHGEDTIAYVSHVAPLEMLEHARHSVE